MTSSLLVYIAERGACFKQRMETDKYVTLVSDTDNANNFSVSFFNELTLSEDWEVALVQAYIPHNDSHFQDNFKKFFSEQ